MFSLSKGEPPTPPSTTTANSPNTEHCELRKTESQPTSVESSTPTDQQRTESEAREVPSAETISVAMLPDSGYEASPFCGEPPTSKRDPDSLYFFIDDSGSDDVFEPDDDDDDDDDEARAMMLFGLDDDDDLMCPDCGEISCSCSRAESSATVRAAVYTDPNTCDSDSSGRSSSPQSPQLSIPESCPHVHSERLPCPRCSRNESLEVPSSSSMSYLPNIVVSRSYPGSYPAALLTSWWNQTSPEFPPRVAAAPSRTSNRSDDRRSTRSRRRQIDSDASSSSSCDENSSDELFPTSCEEGSYLENLGTMTEAEELRVTSPEQLPDLVPLSSDSSSRRLRSQSVSIPLDHEYLREVGISLRRFSNEFENRFAERDDQPRRSSLTSFLNLNWRS